MYCIKGTRKSTLLLVCHRNFKVPQYFKVLLGNHTVLWRVSCYEFISKWVLEGTDQVLSWVLLHSMFRYPVTKIIVCWWSNLIFDLFHFFLSKQLIIFFRFYFILFYLSNTENSSRSDFDIWPDISWSNLHQTTSG